MKQRRIPQPLTIGGEYVITPSPDKWYRALQLTPLVEVKVVLLGQDPYPTKGVADGLAFSVSKRASKFPASLANIFQELVADLGCAYPAHGDLSSWAKQGVLLLNTSLTTEVNRAGSHGGLGWEELAQEILEVLRRRRVVIHLWGRHAQRVYDTLPEVVTTEGAGPRCVVFRSSHPSPLSHKVHAPVPFTGSKPFSKTNKHLLEAWNLEPIQWDLNA